MLYPNVVEVPSRRVLSDVFTSALVNIREGGGDTVSLQGVRPVAGFAFAPRKDTERLVDVDLLTVESISSYVAEFASELAAPDTYLGAWVDESRDVCVFDVSRVLPALDLVLQYAAASEQDAVYDIERGVEIAV